MVFQGLHQLIFLYTAFASLVGAAWNSNNSSLRDLILSDMFVKSKYKIHERPNEHEDRPTEVIVYIKILAVTSVDVINMQYTADMYLRQAWIDPRLAWDKRPYVMEFKRNISIPSIKSRLWLPDLFFRNGKEGYLHKMTVPNYLLRLSPNGAVLYSQKITMHFSCQMHLINFPMDAQSCEMNIGSYGYTLDQLKFVWRENSPVVLDSKMMISEFSTPKTVKTEDCTTLGTTSTGTYTCLVATFQMQRQLGFYLVATYIPAMLIVMVSWLSFWVSIEAVPARITLGLLTLLGILTQGSTMMADLPRVSYIKAIDIWIIACILFVIGALIEFAVASTRVRQHQQETWQIEVRAVVRQELARFGFTYQQGQQGGLEGQTLPPPPPLAPPTSAAPSVTPSLQHRKYTAVPSTSLNNSPGPTSTTLKRNPYYPPNVYPPGAVLALGYQPMPPANLVASYPSLNHNNSIDAIPNEELENLLTNQIEGRRYMSGYSQSQPGYAAHPSADDVIVSVASQPPPPSSLRAPQTNLTVESEIDSYSRFLFPACFLLYNCFYWLYYLVIVRHFVGKNDDDP